MLVSIIMQIFFSKYCAQTKWASPWYQRHGSLGVKTNYISTPYQMYLRILLNKYSIFAWKQICKRKVFSTGTPNSSPKGYVTSHQTSLRSLVSINGPPRSKHRLGLSKRPLLSKHRFGHRVVWIKGPFPPNGRLCQGTMLNCLDHHTVFIKELFA